MTDNEKAIVMAYTGKCMLTGDKFQIFHKYVEDIMGRSIMTHEIGLLANEIKEKSKADFKALCADESGLENSNRWISCSERLPKANGRYLVTRGLNACGSIWNRVYIINYSDLMGLKSERIWWDGNVGKSDFEQIEDVFAWMPIPEPYKAERR